jgi:peroxiredoxin
MLQRMHYKLLIHLIIVISLFTNCDSMKNNRTYKIPNDPHEIIPIKIGDRIPEINLTDINYKEINLRALLNESPTVLVYHRGSWCMYCNQQINQLQEMEQDLNDIGYQIIVVTADNPSKIKGTVLKNKITYNMFSDSTMNGAISLGIAYDAGNIYKDMLKILEENSNENHHILPVPSLFIVNMDWIIQFTYINPDFRINIKPELLLAAAKSAIDE